MKEVKYGIGFDIPIIKIVERKLKNGKVQTSVFFNGKLQSVKESKTSKIQPNITTYNKVNYR